MILVTAANGTVGSETVKYLVAKGIPVRALVGDRTKAQTLARAGAELAEGRLGDPSAVRTAMERVTGVVLICPHHLNQVHLESQAIDLAVEAGVKRIVKLSGAKSQIHPDSPVQVGRWHYEIERHLADAAVTSAVVRPMYFMQNLLQNASMVRDGHVLAAPMADARVSMVDARDIAEVCAHALDGDRTDYVVTGPEALGFGDVAEQMTRVFGMPVSYYDAPREVAEQALLARGEPPWVIDHIFSMVALFHQGAGAAVTSTVADVCGRPPRTLETFLTDYSEAFLAQIDETSR